LSVDLVPVPSVLLDRLEVRMSSRTLQRRLEELGTSYQRLLDDVRRDTARRLLVDTDLDAGEVAFFLGFEELNSFTRAFHAWEGVTPSRWRESRHG
jgi:AraC-like DNA-binding protein